MNQMLAENALNANSWRLILQDVSIGSDNVLTKTRWRAIIRTIYGKDQ